MGKTLSTKQVAVWILSQHLCNGLSLDFDKLMKENVDVDFSCDKSCHNEEEIKRKHVHTSDRNKIIAELKRTHQPIANQAYDALTNIISGHVAPYR